MTFFISGHATSLNQFTTALIAALILFQTGSTTFSYSHRSTGATTFRHTHASRSIAAIIAVAAIAIAIRIATHTGLMMFSYSQVATAPMASQAVFMAGHRVPVTQSATTLRAALMPFQAGLIAFCQSHIAPVAITSHAVTIPGQSVSRTHPHTTEAAALMPAHAGLIAFSYIQRPAVAIASQAATMPGHRTVFIQSHTADMADLMADQATSTIFWPTSVCVKNQTRAATSAAIATVMSIAVPEMGAVSTANTAVAAFAAHIAAEYAKTAAAIPPTTHANGSIQDQLSFTQPNAPWIFSPISGSFSIAPTSASPIGAISGVIFSISGNITPPSATCMLSLAIRH